MQTQIFGRALSRSALAGLAVVVAVLVSAGVVAAVGPGSPTVRSSCAARSCPTAAPMTSRQTVAPNSTTTATTLKASGTTKRAPAVPPKAPAAPKWETSLPSVHLAAPIVATTSGFGGKGLFMVASDGGVFPVGQAGFYGSVAGQRLFGPITAAAADPATGGYWLAGADGGVFAFNAPYLRGVASNRLFAPIVAMAATPDGKGYWLVGADGGIFTFGDALFYGSVSSNRLFAPIVAMAATPDGKGYWLVGADGGIFTFGDALFYGSVSSNRLFAPIVAIAATPDGKGYWLVGRDGGVFPFGDAPFLGSPARTSTSASVRAIVATPSGHGYWLTGAVGGVFSYGDAPAVADTSPEPSLSIASVGKARTIVHSQVVKYASGSSGYDLSQYQCGQIPPSRQKIAVVQVSGGYLDSAPNPCYVQEAKWAGPNMSAYIYLGGLPSPAPASAYQGPRGACSANDIPCQSYNYGYNWTRHWIAYSRSVGVDPKLWWLDVERYSGWNGVLSNDLVITGALDALRQGHLAVGIYSSSDQWSEIAGNLPLPGYPLWVPGAGNRVGAGYTASSFCHSGEYAFAGGRVKVVQFGYQGPFPGTYTGPAIPYDRDFAC